MSYQDGHRQRMKKRFREEGLDNFTDEHALEMMLYYCIPRQDTKELAYRLIRQFGGLNQVLDAPAAELEKVEGVGQNVTTYLMMVRQFMRRYYIGMDSTETFLNSVDEYCDYLKSFFLTEREEIVYLLCLDAKCKVISCKKISEGSVNTAVISVRKVVEAALNANATSVILAHNHPGGLAIPSKEDINTTVQVAKALQAVDVILADHVIVANKEAISMVQSRCYRPLDWCVTY